MFQSIMARNNLTAHVSAISGGNNCAIIELYLIPRFLTNFICFSDRTQHLLWRLTQGGELPATVDPDFIVVLIGTNNLPHNTIESTALGIQRIVDVIHNAKPNATILLNEMFPRYDRIALRSDKASSTRQLNVILKDTFEHPDRDVTTAASGGEIKYLECAYLFDPTPLQRDLDKKILVNTDLMPDKLHPSSVGMAKWLTECIIPAASGKI